MASSPPLVLGIDGGGTKTVAWLATLHTPEAPAKDILGRGIAGPGNPRAAGFEVAQVNIDAAIEAAFADAKLSREAAVAACFGLAGCGRAEEQQRVIDWAESRGIAYMLQVTTDAEPVLAAASADNCGIALICGTGSLAWGRNPQGETGRAGGWGYLIGDEGSGYAIALAGLRGAARQSDGRQPSAGLLQRMQEALAARSPEEFIGKVYSSEMTRQRLAGLASAVFDAALADAAAREILADAAVELAEMIRAVAERLGFQRDQYTLACAGGVLTRQPAYVEMLQAALGDCSREPRDTVLVHDPVQGAVALARRLAHISAG